MTPREAFTNVDRCARESEIDQLLMEMLRYPSPQTDRLESDPQIKKFISELAAVRLAKLTGNAGTIDAMGNLFWRLGGAGSDGLLLMGYAMTFPAASMRNAFSGARMDGRALGITGECAVGRGACEQKGALAAMIYAAGVVARAQLPLRTPLILAVSVAGETGRHDAAQFMLENGEIRAQSAIVGLGTSDQICLGNKGRIDVEITVRGKSAHSSMPWKGANAVDGFRRVMERLDRLPLGTSAHGLADATLTITQVRSEPEISHTIPDVCRVMLDRRLLPGEDPDTAFHDIENALEDVDNFTVEAKRGAVMYPSDVAENCTVALTAGAAIRELYRKEAGFCYSPAALDAGFLNRHGIETIMFGPGDLRFAHTDQEAVALQEVRDAAKIYAATALQLLA